MMWEEYVPMYQRRENAKKEMEKLRKKGKLIEPIETKGKKIASEFWGMKWCNHMEKFSDFSNRLARGKTYVRNGSVCHLSIEKGQIEAIVSGSQLYKVSISIKTLATNKWELIKKRCSGYVGSILEILQGKISNYVMEIVSDCNEGLFPTEKEIAYTCSCPDWAYMCKHVAAVIYGIGSRLDTSPEQLFILRGVEPQELINVQLNLENARQSNLLENTSLSSLFDITLENSNETSLSHAGPKLSKPKKRKAGNALNIETLNGKDLKTFRKKKKLSVAEFSKALEVTPATIYRWENCPTVLSLQNRSKNALIKMIHS